MGSYPAIGSARTLVLPIAGNDERAMNHAEQITQMLQRGDIADVRRTVPNTAFDAAYLALVLFGHGDIDLARHRMRQAAQFVPDDPVYSAAHEYLTRVQQQGIESVYASGEGFGAFIRGGGNVGLYEATSAALRQAYSDGVARLLDIGVGDGLALVPALCAQVAHITLVEPSRAMLDRTVEQLHARGAAFEAHHSTLQAFIVGNDRRWNLAEATFSLQSIAPDEREPLLGWLHDHVDRLLIAEFDVPPLTDTFDPAFVRSVLDRYRVGLSEYTDDRALVAQEFLMPVMFGVFDQGTARTNYEQPIAAWIDQLRAAGFARVDSHLLYDYWWSPAHLIAARNERAAPPRTIGRQRRSGAKQASSR